MWWRGLQSGRAWPACAGVSSRAGGLLEGAVADAEWPSVGAEAFRLLYSSLTHGWGEQ